MNIEQQLQQLHWTICTEAQTLQKSGQFRVPVWNVRTLSINKCRDDVTESGQTEINLGCLLQSFTLTIHTMHTLNSSDSRPSYPPDNHHSSHNIRWKGGEVASMKKTVCSYSLSRKSSVSLNTSASCVLFLTYSYCKVKQLETMPDMLHMVNLHSTAMHWYAVPIA